MPRSVTLVDWKHRGWWAGFIYPIDAWTYQEEVNYSWAPEGSRCWQHQYNNMWWYLNEVDRVWEKVIEQFNNIDLLFPFLTLHKDASDCTPVVTRIGKFTGDYYLWRGAKAGINMLRGMYHRNKLYKAIRASGQGRVQNWKQIKQTGTGLKIRRRRRGRKKESY
ncbi:uncharacterized protein MONOS_17736 [Monocercomonoides exilis]|uniref:uncharacterized protein n=1 Tax=Monocercomonoides exilis TaxID=2049356 RepID=UPI0035593874|nr:hypothetical protein MONOS_17736 [Monocercomonoides exilis]